MTSRVLQWKCTASCLLNYRTFLPKSNFRSIYLERKSRILRDQCKTSNSSLFIFNSTAVELHPSTPLNIPSASYSTNTPAKKRGRKKKPAETKDENANDEAYDTLKTKESIEKENLSTFDDEPPKLSFPFYGKDVSEVGDRVHSNELHITSDITPVDNILGNDNDHSNTTMIKSTDSIATCNSDNTKITNTNNVITTGSISNQLPRQHSPDAFTRYHSDNFVSKVDTDEGRYYVFESPVEDRYKLASVTTILQSTLPKSRWFGLYNWRKSMIATHGETGYRKIRKETIKNGTKFHELLEEKLQVVDNHPKRDQTGKGHHNSSHNNGSTNNHTAYTRTPVTAQSSYIPSYSHSTSPDTNSWDILCDLEEGFTSLAEGVKETSDKPHLEYNTNESSPLKYSISKSHRYMESVKSVLSDVSDVIVTEGIVKHEELGYSGTVDCVARYKGELCVIDWKTSTKPKPHFKDLHDYPLQAVAYAGAINNDTTFNFKVQSALIVVVYHTGSEAHVHWLDSDKCQEYWEKWLDRLNQFQTQFAHDLSNIRF